MRGQGVELGALVEVDGRRFEVRWLMGAEPGSGRVVRVGEDGLGSDLADESEAELAREELARQLGGG